MVVAFSVAVGVFSTGCTKQSDVLSDGTSVEVAQGYATTSTDSRYVQNIAMYQRTEGALEDVVRVKFKRQALSAEMSAALAKSAYAASSAVAGCSVVGVSAVDQVSLSVAGVRLERVFPYAPKYEADHIEAGLDLWYDVYFDAPEQARVSAARDGNGGDKTAAAVLGEVVRAYSALQEIEYVETIKRVTLLDDSPVRMLSSSNLGPKLSGAVGSRAAMPFNDPQLNFQWHYQYTDKVADMNPNADIKLFDAWTHTAGDRDIIVCVVDEGIDYTHEDLAANMWTNESEIPGNGIDDDGNGYIDDVHGYNFVAQSPNIVSPIKGHGTHVAGTVAAVNNNGLGVCGVAGGTGKGDGVRLISAQVFDDTVLANGKFHAQAIVYGADNGAVISQNSWGMSVDDTQKSIEDAIDYFVDKAGRLDKFPNSPMVGGIFIVGTGNFSSTFPQFPASYKKTLGVSATNHLRIKAGYSNYGGWVDMAAPGGDINLGDLTGVLSTMPDNKYGYKSGTSMACPHVSGVAALIIASEKGKITPLQVERRLIASCSSIKDTDPNYYSFMGAGLMDASKVFKADDKKAPAAVVDLALVRVEGGYDLEWTVPSDENDEVISFNVYYSKKPILQTNLAAGIADKSILVMKVDNAQDAGSKFTYSVTANISELAVSMASNGYYFSVTSLDDWSNEALLSNSAVHSVIADDAVAISGANVVRDRVTLMVGKSFVGGRVMISDVSGRVVLSATLAGQSTELLMSNLSSGNYVATAVAPKSTASVKPASVKFRKL